MKIDLFNHILPLNYFTKHGITITLHGFAFVVQGVIIFGVYKKL